MFRRNKPKPPTDDVSRRISSILFPPLELEEKVDPQTKERLKYHIDRTADSNLEAALMDMREHRLDEVTFKTIQSVIDKLRDVRHILQASSEFDSQAKYVIVDFRSDVDWTDEIKPDENFHDFL